MAPLGDPNTGRRPGQTLWHEARVRRCQFCGKRNVFHRPDGRLLGHKRTDHVAHDTRSHRRRYHFSHHNGTCLIRDRSAQGVQWPAMHHLAAQWIPPDERSSFVSSYLGSSVGIAVFSPIFGYMLSTMPWQWVFYLSGSIGTVWYVGWLYFVYDTPAEHPRIDPHERQHIEKSLEGIVHHDREGSVPWKEIFRSQPIWSNIICFWGSSWGKW